MKATFIGDPKASDDDRRSSLEMFGVVFPLNQTVDVSRLPDELQRKLSTNSHFKVSGKAPAAAANDEAKA